MREAVGSRSNLAAGRVERFRRRFAAKAPVVKVPAAKPPVADASAKKKVRK